MTGPVDGLRMEKTRLTSDERKEQILENAVKVFACHGLSGARTRDIAKACGINEALLYRHFENKEDLFRQSVEYTQGKMGQAIASEIRTAKSGIEALQKAMNFQITNLLHNPELSSNMLHGFASSTINEEMRQWVRDWFTRHVGYIRMVLERGIEDGTIQADIDIETVVWQIQGAGWAFTFLSVLEFDEDEVVNLASKLYKDITNNIITDKGKEALYGSSKV